MKYYLHIFLRAGLYLVPVLLQILAASIFFTKKDFWIFIGLGIFGAATGAYIEYAEQKGKIPPP